MDGAVMDPHSVGGERGGLGRFIADFSGDVLDECRQWDAGDLVAVSRTEADRSLLHLLIAEDDEVGRLEFPMIPDLLHDVVVRIVELNPYTCFLKGMGDFTRIGRMFLSNGDDVALRRREPRREPTGKVFDEHAAKALH